MPAVVDGIRNHLWTALKKAVKEWFNSKIEGLLGLGSLIQILIRGCISFSQIAQMAWQAVLSAIPMMVIQLLIEKLVSLLVPAAAAVTLIIQGLQAAWGAASQIIAAINAFVAFLLAVKTGSAAPQFANLLAAGAVAVIDFIANFLLARLGGALRGVGQRLRGIAQRLQRVAAAARRGARAIGRGLRTAGRAVVRVVRRAGRAIARTRVGRFVVRGLQAGGRAIRRGYRAVQRQMQRLRDRWRQWRERRRQQRAQKERRRQEAAFEKVRRILAQRLRRGLPKLIVLGLLAGLKLWFRFKLLRLFESQATFKVMAGFSPEQEVAQGQVIKVKEEIEKASSTGTRYLFRGDDFYSAGSLGLAIGSREAEAADIQTPWEHVQGKESGQTSRFVSFSLTRRGAAKFTKKNKILKAAMDALAPLEAAGIIKIWTPEAVEQLMRSHEKARIRRLASAVKQDMLNNDEVLIEGQIPEEVFKWAK